MLDIRSARPDEFAAVQNFYHKLIDMMEGAEFHPRWEKYVYPSDDFLRSSIERGELYVGMLGEEIAVAMVINGEGADGYDGAPWRVRAADGEFSVIHALGVLPPHHGRGFARELVRAAIDKTRAKRHESSAPRRAERQPSCRQALRVRGIPPRLARKALLRRHGADGFSCSTNTRCNAAAQRSI